MKVVQLVQWLSILLIVSSNGCLVYFILRQQNKTFLDWLVVLQKSPSEGS